MWYIVVITNLLLYLFYYFIIMKFLSNFDSGLEKRLLAEHKTNFGDDKVISIHRSRYYYRRYIGLPVFWYFVLFVIAFYFIWNSSSFPEWWIWSFFGVFILYGLVLLIKLWHKWIDYKMDFVIITPKEIIKYDQTWAFGREVEKIPTRKIKSISTYKPWFFSSFFNIWSMNFLSEWDDTSGDINLKYVDNVEFATKKISHIIWLNRTVWWSKTT